MNAHMVSLILYILGSICFLSGSVIALIVAT